MKQWLISLVIIGGAHGAILFFQSSSLYESENIVEIAYHHGEEAGVKYRVSLISKRPQNNTKDLKKKVFSKQAQNNSNPKEMPSASGATSIPKFQGKFAPPYHPAAKRRGEQGDVTLLFTVTSTGKVKSVTLMATSGSPRLDRSAIKYIKQLIFAPAKVRGSAVEMKQELTISYRLR
ncbi:MAG: energy transducer TonB [Bacteriovoracaceae bacterium]|nr:energy transducer TonB [Bacteriovoracaceae bacterium]